MATSSYAMKSEASYGFGEPTGVASFPTLQPRRCFLRLCPSDTIISHRLEEAQLEAMAHSDAQDHYESEQRLKPKRAFRAVFSDINAGYLKLLSAIISPSTIPTRVNQAS